MDAARITKLDIEMFHRESWKPICLWVKRSKVKATRHKNSAGVGFCTLVGAGFFWLLLSRLSSSSVIMLRVYSAGIPYEITVWTGDVHGAGTDSNVFIQMYGEGGKTEEYMLRNCTDNFEQGQVDKFKVKRNFEPQFPPIFVLFSE